MEGPGWLLCERIRRGCGAVESNLRSGLVCTDAVFASVGWLGNDVR